MTHDHAPPIQSLRHLVIMPAYNEAGSVGDVVRELKRQLPHFDIVVIDDGSTDHTARAVPPEAAVVSLPFNLGIGGAMQTGYRYARQHGYDVAIQVDADGQHPPDQVRRLVEEFHSRRCDLLIGSRFLAPGGYRQSASRMIGILVLRGLIRLLTGRTITDCTSGFRVVSRRTIRAFAHWYPDDYPEPEVVLLLLRAGFDVQETSVRMEQRRAGHTSIPLLKGLFYVVKVSTCLLLDTIRNPWPPAKVQTP